MKVSKAELIPFYEGDQLIPLLILGLLKENPVHMDMNFWQL